MDMRGINVTSTFVSSVDTDKLCTQFYSESGHTSSPSESSESSIDSTTRISKAFLLPSRSQTRPLSRCQPLLRFLRQWMHSRSFQSVSMRRSIPSKMSSNPIENKVDEL